MNEYVPTRYPCTTSRYDEFLSTLQSDRFINLLMSSDFETSTYESNDQNASLFNLAVSFSKKDKKLSWSTYPEHIEYKNIIADIKFQMIRDNSLAVNIDDMGTAFLLLVPGAHLQEHIDKGNFGGTTLVFPILGTGVFTYDNATTQFEITKPTFASNTVWHNFVNMSNKLVAIMTIAMPIDIAELKDPSLVSVPKRK